MRTEKDFLGEVSLPENALYGINTWRAIQNFPDKTAFHKEWYQAIGLVKLACYNTVVSYRKAALQKHPDVKLPENLLDDKSWEKICETAKEVAVGKYYNSFIVPAIQGGAGTSINMNVNEIITNASLKKLGKKPGDYKAIDPFDHANIFQSTNDVIPTALKVASMQLFTKLEKQINQLRSGLEKLETKTRSNLRVAYTQMQQALPSSYGMLFSAYNDALARDWWRVSKCFERIKIVNLGGGAVGTGLALPRFYIMEVVPNLQKLTKLPVTRAENLSDNTQNFDVFVEVHAILKAHAVNLEKMASDIRLLSSDISDHKELQIPKKQTGSTIMPGKVNPVISEFVISSAHKIYSNDMLVSNLCGQGSLDLNPYIPAIGHALIDSLKLLIAACQALTKNLVSDMKVNAKFAHEKIIHSPTMTTALIPFVGYQKASELAALMIEKNISIVEANEIMNCVSDAKLKEVMKPENLLKLGYSLGDIN
ncbi:MAG: lyase family protein [Bacteroidales bacterium]